MLDGFDSKKLKSNLSAANRDIRASLEADKADELRFYESHSRDSKNLDAINEQFKKLNFDLAQERAEREKGEKRNFVFNMITGAISVLSLGIAIASFVMQILGR